ncbi:MULTISPECIES: RNA-binding S4 domain-containing protein [Lysinibacillus]|uniref:RQC P-site tRNA stabilizing factor n=1 Tax=Lysinibacillus pakistanensis TaxID=759811 RepID=A0AAX3WX76_9BACI|nr:MULTISPECIES: RNA-binding S4 domain-containing protein [Lysinibacillus]MDM5231194.1 RNA-binding S4 domain-containing protein [Lysinibacillus pakistanensis]QGG49515.1 RNA-binding S4 domain-containing protein [Lysinibacillus pakistanensis]WHY46749.1 RNA-binding S4 domain-containing protein [Lysinibacillus pakistanensis]WHY51762.1 RNA-binding S4 domain-containing protein [Lysinibacillus pakistanensis]
MRLDKFLKVSRLIKRRTLAKEVADQGRITINGKVAKASSTVKAGDELAIRFGQKIVTARVDELRDTVKKEDAAKMFTILKEERLDKIEPEFIDDEE